MALANKITITPVYGLTDECDDEPFDKSVLPFVITRGVQLADVQDKMASADFELWRKEFMSKREVEELKGWRYALVYTYKAEEYLQSQPEQESEDLVHKIFLGLRIVRPSPQPYASLQARLIADDKIEPFSFSHPGLSLVVPDAESINAIRNRDAENFRAIAATLLKAFEEKCGPVIRAIRNLEVGYLSRFLYVQQLLWVTGLDSLFTSREWKHSGSWVATERIKNFLGSEYRIYGEGDLPSYVPTPTTTVADLATDIYKLRNYFAHGEWPGKEWTEKPFRKGVAGDTVSYADMLRDATSVFLRASLVRILREDMLELFGDKQKMNTHFAKLGLMRQKKRAQAG